MIEGLKDTIKADSARSTKIDCTSTVEEYINKHDWRINANSNTSFSNAGLVNNIAGKVIANYWLDKVYSKKAGDAHRNGDFHIHDLDCLAPYCFTSDTKVKTVEYGDISIAELLEKNVTEFTVISFKDGEVVNCVAHDLRCTRENAELVEVEFEDGYKVRCTPDHKFLLTDGTWKSIEKIATEDDIKTVNGVARVKILTHLSENENVYCMTVDDTHCFALENGVIAHNCCGHDLQRLLDEGFNGVPGRPASAAPKHFREALGQMANYLGILQAEWAGAQAFSSFDTYLAPYVFFDMYYGGATFEDIKKAILQFIYNLNVPARWGQCVPTNYKCLRADGQWVSYSDLNVGDKIYVVDPETGKLKTDTLTHVNVFDGPEKMHRYMTSDGKYFDVTDNHRVIYKDLTNNTYKIAPSSELIGDETVAIATTKWGASSVIEPGFDINDNLIRFIAHYIFALGFNQIVNESRFEQLCSALDFKFNKINNETDESSGFTVDMGTAAPAIMSIIFGENYRFDFINRLSTRQCEVFLTEWTNIAALDSSKMILRGINADFQDILAYLAIRVGKSATVRTITIEETLVPVVEIISNPTVKCSISEVEYQDEQVWCPTTNTGTFVCMTDDGFVFVTGNSPFTNITVDWKVPADMKDNPPMRDGEHYFVSIFKDYAEQDKIDANKLHRMLCKLRTRLDVEIDMDRILIDADNEYLYEILYQISYSIFEDEMIIIDKAFYECLNEGDLLGQPFVFPIPTINITEDFDWDDERANVLFENAAKYGSSYFQNFIGSQYIKDENGNKIRDPKAYGPDDVRSMCPLSIDTQVVTRRKEGNEWVIENVMLKDIKSGVHQVMYKDEWREFNPFEVEDKHTDGVNKYQYVDMDVCLVKFGDKEVKFGKFHIQPIIREGSEITHYKMAGAIRAGDKLPVYDFKTKTIKPVEVTEVIKVEREPVMCISVDSPEHLFTLSNGLITHNCRLKLDLAELRKKGGGLFGADSQTGSIGNITFNMARLGYLYKGNLKAIYKRLDYLLNLAVECHEKKRKFVTEMNARGLYPYTRRYIRTFDTYFSTIGLNGMNEMVRNFTNDEHDITTEYGQKMCMEIMMYLRERLVQIQEETGNLYNLEASPSEGATYRLAKYDFGKFAPRSVAYIECEKHGKVEINENYDDTEYVECPICRSESEG